MSTFMFKNENYKYTPVSNIFIDKFMPRARGEFVKVYLLGLKYCASGEIGATSSVIANTLGLLETDVVNAWNYWNDENTIKMTPIDNMGNFNIEFLDLLDVPDENIQNINLLEELANSSIKGMLQDIEKLLAKPLSPKEMTMYLSWQKDYSFAPELILLLIQYCVSKGKVDYRYIETIAIAWHDANIKNIEDAQSYIKKHEDKWINIRKILNYLGIKAPEIMKPQEQILDKWVNVYKFSLEVIFKACDICFDRLSRADFKYIDGILNSWFKDGIKSLEDIEKKDKKRLVTTKNVTAGGKPAKGSFNDYEQRAYDFDELEKKLLGWDKND
ncbi:DnaD domain protein [Clostridium tagluense]|uniref:DnaD domain protein n=1 Tax=Clostridium TaxID=1485 RepID=UPI0013E94D77|nr:MULTISPECIES: DnaD domain protein [Clostridium]MBU3129462.1 DnaD domain protein [Clostridium tagluense]MBW9156072.1 DnaD domain protein [Clostridium tagluense]MBZ9625954.1 DnaD domain protein [Clostridium sp. FP2]MCB2313106.1 DnaD domain protein [Clostridium tagluense]MCB2317872.1 DnaD domain protein [Clostridium tagluense]